MKKRIESVTLDPTRTIKAAMEAMEAGKAAGAPAGIIIINPPETQELVGVVSDGDIRRALVSGRSLETPLSEIMNEDPLAITDGSSAGAMLSQLHYELERRGEAENKYHHIVVVDDSNGVLDVVTPFELWKRSEIRINSAAVVGLGFVGLTFALTLAQTGVNVRGIENDQHVRAQLAAGEPHFHEDGLKPLLQKHLGENFVVQKDLEDVSSDLYIICVETPISANKTFDSASLRSAARDVGAHLSIHDLVVIRSTVVVGTCREVVVPILEQESGMTAGEDFFVSYAPERTVAGNALKELRSLPQVIGGINKTSTDYTSQLFQLFSKSIIPVSSLDAAEAVKLLNNSYRDLRFSFANETARICDAIGLDAHEVIKAANEGYKRNQVPRPSPGVGGACLTKDPYMLVESGKRGNYYPQLPRVSREINESMINHVIDKVHRYVTDKSHAGEITISIMGMAFKRDPETSDMRHSPSVRIAEELQAFVDRIVVHDPVVPVAELQENYPNVATSIEEAFSGADGVLFLTNHPSFENINVSELAETSKRPALIFDPWGILNPEEAKSLAGVTYDRFSGQFAATPIT